MTTHEPILARLSALKAMSVKDLKAEWQVLFNAPAPNNSRGFLEGRLAYRIQELTYGGPDKQTRRMLDLLADEVDGTLTQSADCGSPQPCGRHEAYPRMGRRRSYCDRPEGRLRMGRPTLQVTVRGGAHHHWNAVEWISLLRTS